MDLLDRLALAGRRLERRRSIVDGSAQIGLDEVLRMLHGKTILEVAVKGNGKPSLRTVHSPGRPVSVLDFIADADGGHTGTYEVLQTPPSGDYSRFRIISRPSGREVSVLAGPRTSEHSSSEDPLLQSLKDRGVET